MAAPLVLPATTVPGAARSEGEKIARVVRHASTAANAAPPTAAAAVDAASTRGEGLPGAIVVMGAAVGVLDAAAVVAVPAADISSAAREARTAVVASVAAVVDADLAGVAAGGGAAATVLPAVVAAASQTQSPATKGV